MKKKKGNYSMEPLLEIFQLKRKEYENNVHRH